MNNRRVRGNVVIMGAGPAGITAAVELNRHDTTCVIIEKEFQPGGLARTIEYKGYRFDIGGHRFYTKISEIQQWWEEILGAEFLTRTRKSSIFYRGHVLEYPLRIGNLISELGVGFCLRAFLSYIHALLKPQKPEISFEHWISNHFGTILYRAFFKSYTEKVWGIPCSELSATWAAQRIKGLSFFTVIQALLFKQKGASIKTLITQFQYPRLGPGQMWEAAIAHIPSQSVYYGETVCRIEWEEHRILRIHSVTSEGQETTYEGDHFLSTIAMKDLITAMGDRVPAEVKNAADKLGVSRFHYDCPYC